MPYYAQIDSGIVVAVTQTAGVIQSPNMVEVDGLRSDLIGYSYDPQSNSFSPAALPVVPSSVTMRQARLALLGVDKLAAVEAALEALPEPDKTQARIWWEYSGTVERANPLVNAIGGAVGLDAEALDALFTAAQSL